MARLNVHPAAGIEGLLPGWFNVPQNPITMAQQGVTYTPGIGELVPAKFTVPQNPLMDRLTSASVLAPQPCKSLGSCGCGCGMGDIDTSSVGAVLDSDVMGIPLTWILGGSVLAYFLFGSRGTEYKYEKAKLKRKYKTRAGAVAGTYRNLTS
jgi:hypothetical protein